MRSHIINHDQWHGRAETGVIISNHVEESFKLNFARSVKLKWEKMIMALGDQIKKKKKKCNSEEQQKYRSNLQI